jgi:hypothetical protein
MICILKIRAGNCNYAAFSVLLINDVEAATSYFAEIRQKSVKSDEFLKNRISQIVFTILEILL